MKHYFLGMYVSNEISKTKELYAVWYVGMSLSFVTFNNPYYADLFDSVEDARQCIKDNHLNSSFWEIVEYK